jgi:uncharacterized membrane protein YeaQ/YmgE (transglycosylase-associated protein family)
VLDLNPGGLLAWIAVGLLAGWIAGMVTRREGFGCLGNIAIGLIGAVLGGIILELFDFEGTVRFLGSIAVATFGAVVLLAVANLARR